MEKLYFNLSEEDISKSRKVILWIVTAFFFIGAAYVAMLSPVFGQHSVDPLLAIAPLGIGLLVGATALFATVKRKDIFFLIDEEKIEFRFGIFNPKRHSFPWKEVKKLVMPHRERKAKVILDNGTFHVIDLTYIQRKKATLIRKHLYHTARLKNIDVLTVASLTNHK